MDLQKLIFNSGEGADLEFMPIVPIGEMGMDETERASLSKRPAHYSFT